MNLCRGINKTRDGAKIARTSWSKDRLTYLVFRIYVDPDDPRQAIDKFENGELTVKDWKPTTEELLADDWRVLRGV